MRPSFTKDDKTDTENYRPIIILPNLSKLYKRLMFDQLHPFFDQLFLKLQCGFRKRFNTNRCLHMTEKWRNYLDTERHDSVLPKELSKTFNFIDH